MPGLYKTDDELLDDFEDKIYTEQDMFLELKELGNPETIRGSARGSSFFRYLQATGLFAAETPDPMDLNVYMNFFSKKKLTRHSVTIDHALYSRLLGAVVKDGALDPRFGLLPGDATGFNVYTTNGLLLVYCPYFHEVILKQKQAKQKSDSEMLAKEIAHAAQDVTKKTSG